MGQHLRCTEGAKRLLAFGERAELLGDGDLRGGGGPRRPRRPPAPRARGAPGGGGGGRGGRGGGPPPVATGTTLELVRATDMPLFTEIPVISASGGFTGQFT
ncbi:hypothetical protein Q6A22_04595, partial [Xanthomonas euvesicatoria pv. eucalypti]